MEDEKAISNTSQVSLWLNAYTDLHIRDEEDATHHMWWTIGRDDEKASEKPDRLLVLQWINV